ncbi:MAG: hypothetical protein KY461_05990 [Actinobacteria bacterium]|nr:hypothetical protein [Actinomycetota bacterium]
MTDADPAGERDPRVRRTWRIAGLGTLAGAGLAVLSGVLGADGRVGFVILFLVTALGAALAALYAGLTAVIDDLKGRRVARARVVSAGGLFVLAALLMAVVAGAGG